VFSAVVQSSLFGRTSGCIFEQRVSGQLSVTLELQHRWPFSVRLLRWTVVWAQNRRCVRALGAWSRIALARPDCVLRQPQAQPQQAKVASTYGIFFGAREKAGGPREGVAAACTASGLFPGRQWLVRKKEFY
jgi:hypothetical protein